MKRLTRAAVKLWSAVGSVGLVAPMTSAWSSGCAQQRCTQGYWWLLIVTPSPRHQGEGKRNTVVLFDRQGGQHSSTARRLMRQRASWPLDTTPSGPGCSNARLHRGLSGQAQRGKKVSALGKDSQFGDRGLAPFRYPAAVSRWTPVAF